MDYEISLITTIGITVMFALSLNLVTGFCGQISLGHAAFLGLGAYATGLVVVRLHGGFAGALLASTVTGLLVGGLLAFPALRAPGPCFRALVFFPLLLPFWASLSPHPFSPVPNARLPFARRVLPLFLFFLPLSVFCLLGEAPASGRL